MSVINRLIACGGNRVMSVRNSNFHGAKFQPKIEPLSIDLKKSSPKKTDSSGEENIVLEAFMECESFADHFVEYHEMRKQQTGCSQHAFVSGDRFCNIAHTSATYGISKIVFNIVIRDIPFGDSVQCTENSSDEETISLFSGYRLIPYVLEGECEFTQDIASGTFGLIIKDGQIYRGAFCKKPTTTELYARPYGAFDDVEIDGKTYHVSHISVKDGRAWIKCMGFK